MREGGKTEEPEKASGSMETQQAAHGARDGRTGYFDPA